LAPAVEQYLVEIVLASRDAGRYDAELARRIAWGASPRGSIALERCARAHAWLAGRDFVAPGDARAVAPDVLRHRAVPSYEATAEGWDGERLVQALLAQVALPCPAKPLTQSWAMRGRQGPERTRAGHRAGTGSRRHCPS